MSGRNCPVVVVVAAVAVAVRVGPGRAAGGGDPKTEPEKLDAPAGRCNGSHWSGNAAGTSSLEVQVRGIMAGTTGDKRFLETVNVSVWRCVRVCV